MLCLALVVVLVGQVTEVGGEGAPGALVEVVDVRGRVLKEVRTDGDGGFRIEWEVAEGVYALRALKPGCITATVPFSVHKSLGHWVFEVGARGARKTMRLQNQNKIDLGRLVLKSFLHAVTVTVIGLVGVFFILGVLFGVIRGANVLFRRLS